MDHLDALTTLDILDLLEEEAEHEDRPPRTRIVPLHRDFLALSEAAFLSHFRFTKAGFESLLGPNCVILKFESDPRVKV